MLLLLSILAACSPEPLDLTGNPMGSESRSRDHIPVRGEWTLRTEGTGRERHVMQATAKLRPSDKPTAVQVDFGGEGDVFVALMTGDGWVIAGCGGYVADESLVCLATATRRPYSGLPRIEVWTRTEDEDRPTPIGAHVRLEVPL